MVEGVLSHFTEKEKKYCNNMFLNWSLLKIKIIEADKIFFFP